MATQDNDTTIQAPAKESPAEATAREALRNGLCAAGIDHDEIERIADRCLSELHDAGLLRKTPADIIHEVEPDATEIMVRYYVHRIYHKRDGTLNMWRTRAKAEEIAAALTENMAGAVVVTDHDEVRDDGEHCCWINVIAEDAEFTVYYHEPPKEAQ